VKLGVKALLLILLSSGHGMGHPPVPGVMVVMSLLLKVVLIRVDVRRICAPGSEPLLGPISANVLGTNPSLARYSMGDQ